MLVKTQKELDEFKKEKELDGWSTSYTTDSFRTGIMAYRNVDGQDEIRVCWLDQ